MSRTIHVADFTEQDEVEARIVYSRCKRCGNQYASSILDACPICRRCDDCGWEMVALDGCYFCERCDEIKMDGQVIGDDD